MPLNDIFFQSTTSTDAFLTNLKPLYNLCVNENCRHFVKIFDNTTTKETFKKNLLTVESYFYKYLTNEEYQP
jgi:hypothetical protein